MQVDGQITKMLKLSENVKFFVSAEHFGVLIKTFIAEWKYIQLFRTNMATLFPKVKSLG